MTVTIENNYTGNGSTTDYSFTFPYLDTSDIKVSIGGSNTTAYSLANATTVSFDSAPANDSLIRIYRSTSYDSPKATYYPGSAIRANDLNDNALQNLYVTQEANVDILNSWKKGDPTIISTENWQSDNTKIATTGAIDGRVDAKIDTAMESDVLAGTDMAKTATSGQVTINHSVSGANATVNNSNGTVLQDITVSAQGHVTAIGSYDLDNRYYTKTETDAAYFNVSTGDTIKDGDAFPDNDTTIATTAAINDRIIDLVDDVGGFVAIANETSFPTTNPDVNNGTGTIVSIKALASNLTSNGSGVATIANGAGSGNTVTINGLANSTTYAATFGMLVETTSVTHTYTFHRQTPKATEVTTVAGSISNINTVAGSISAINTVNSNLTNINSVNSNSSNINAVAGEIVFSEDLGSIADSLSTGSGNDIDTVAGAITNINTVAGISSNITTVAGISSNVTSVAGNASNINSAVSNASNINSAVSNASNINSAVSNASNINSVVSNASNINTVAGSIADINRYAAEYKIASSAPSSPSEGDLWYDSANNVLKYHTGSAFTGITPGLTDLVNDTTPELGGHLDCNDKNLTEVGTVSGDNLQIDFGSIA